MKLVKTNPKIYIFSGHYGSGKTEIAVNFAIHLKKLSPNRNVAICDMDIVNPFFRTADAAHKLEEKGIRVELPLYANSNVDVPALTPQMQYLIEEKNTDLVLDIGGDDVGAKAIGCYADSIMSRDYEHLFVLNKNRPFTKDLETTLKIYNEIQASALVPYTGIVNNTHLLQYTNAETLKSGLPLCYELSDNKKIPVVFNAIMANENISGFDEPVLEMNEYIKLLWDRSSSV